MRCLCAGLLFAICALGQDLRERFLQMQDPVTVAYSLARLGATVCKSDKPAGARMVLEAFDDMKKLPDDAFDKSETPLAVSSFTALSKVVLQSAHACDVESKILLEGAVKNRLIGEYQKANIWLNKALEAKRPERAVQLADAAFATSNHGSQLRTKALYYGDESRLSPEGRKPDIHLIIPPFVLDLSLFTKVLAHVRMTAPDLADNLFQKTIDAMMSSTPPTAAELGEMARYIFAASSATQMPVDPSWVILPPGGLPMANFLHAPLNGNFDLALSLLNKSAQVVQDYRTTSADLLDCYALAYQMLQKAREYDLDDVGPFQTALLGLEAKLGARAGKIREDIGPAPAADAFGAPQSDFALAAQALSRLRAGRFDTARSLLTNLRDAGVRSEVEELIVFEEAAASLPKNDAGSLLGHPSYPEGGVKRALLYAALVPASSHETALQAILLGLKEAESLPAAQRVCVLSTLAGVALPVDAGLSANILRLTVSAQNDADSEPPAKSKLRCGMEGVQQVLEIGADRLAFPLSVPGVSTYTIDSILSRAKKDESPALESTILDLHDETLRASALLTLAESRGRR